MRSTAGKPREMRLSVMARAYRDQESAPEAASADFDERLAMPAGAEWDARRTNRRVGPPRRAGLSAPDANVADVRHGPDRRLDRDRITELAGCGWVRDARNVVAAGATGSGKTWIACALGVAACNAFHTVRYVRMPEMPGDLCVKKDEGRAKTKKRYVSCDLLIVDDWMPGPLKSDEAREAPGIVEARNRRGSMLLCSRFSAGGWAAKIGEGAVAEAIIDRMVRNSYVIHIEGDESMRKRMGGFA